MRRFALSGGPARAGRSIAATAAIFAIVLVVTALTAGPRGSGSNSDRSGRGDILGSERASSGAEGVPSSDDSSSTRQPIQSNPADVVAGHEAADSRSAEGAAGGASDRAPGADVAPGSEADPGVAPGRGSLTPGAPVSVSVVAADMVNVISWERPETGDPAGYIVSRSASVDGVYSVIARLGASTTSCSDEVTATGSRVLRGRGNRE